MKLLLSIIFFLNFFTGLGQRQFHSESEKIVEAPYHPPVIKIYKDDNLIDSSASSFRGSSIYKIDEPGRYKLEISAVGMKSVFYDSIIVASNSLVRLIINMSGTCIYDYPTNYTPICPKQHTDDILPIEYGLILRVVRKGQQFAEPTFFHSGGCVTTDCDPKFYCKVHKLEF